MDKKVSSLSGGERAKLAICVFENTCGNVLVLDEPTNHLDLPARESLEEALKAFDGTVIFVSHDRYFISAIAEQVVEIENARLNTFEGGYDGYKRAKSAAAESERLREEARQREEYESRKQSAYRSKKDRAREAQLKAELKAIEADISAGERLEEELTERLADPEVACDFEKIKEIAARLDEVRARLEKLYERYGELI